jgi:opine dehydrogenase
MRLLPLSGLVREKVAGVAAYCSYVLAEASMRTVTVLGGGNGAHAAAADLSLKGFRVKLFSLSSQMLDPIRQQGGITLVDDYGERLVPIYGVCEQIPEALEETDIVLIIVPALAHAAYADACAPYLKAGQIVVLNPGSTGGALAFKNVLRDKRVSADVPVCETNTLAYICRLTGAAKVKITVRTKTQFASLPGRQTQTCFEIFQEIFPGGTARRNVLETSLTNFNAVMHAPGMVMNAGWIEFTKGNFSYYCEGTTPAVAKVIDEIDKERIALCRQIGYSSDRFVEHFYKAGSTSENAFKSGSVYTALQESEPNRFIRAPENLSHRFLSEDVPYGIVPMAHLGKMLGVRTPTINALVDLASVINETNYWQAGWTPERLGIQGMNLEQLLFYVENG